ncbi:DUF364 domain-containing protein [Ideonella sp. DXS22W]|uniref:DUF364 domain-containing protein n=1 Tax=Pseudaquabacterium inlustre TaxID=2984192 RepID=A0ABU9CRV7_9BURK
MRIADDILQQLTRALSGGPIPRVRALHLPPALWTGTKDGEFGAIELDSGALGLSYLLLGGTLAELARRPEAAQQALAGQDALALARRWADGDTPADRALGFAAVNALSRHLQDAAGLAPPDAPDSIGGLAPQAGEPIGMVGFFPPLVKQVTALGAQLTVLELRADLAGNHPGYTVTLDPAALRGCTQVLMTSTVLLNHTLDDVLAHCAGARAIAMIGPGAGLLPDALFARGVTAVGGSWITDRDGFVAALAQGAPWGASARKFVWTPAAWPGLAATP